MVGELAFSTIGSRERTLPGVFVSGLYALACRFMAPCAWSAVFPGEAVVATGERLSWMKGNDSVEMTQRRLLRNVGGRYAREQ